MKNDKVKSLVVVGLMAALVFIFTYVHMDIRPARQNDDTLRNVCACLRRCWFAVGRACGGLRLDVFDMFDPVYLPDAGSPYNNSLWRMWRVCGAHYLFKKLRGARFPLSAAVGALTYTALYLGKTIIVNYFVLGNAWGTVWATVLTKGTVSIVNGVIAAIVSVILASLLRKALAGAGLSEKMGVRE